MKQQERITHEPENPEAWVCICKNTPCDHGFYPCDEFGHEVEPVAGWKELYVCDCCGRIIRQMTLKVIGIRDSSN